MHKSFAFFLLFLCCLVKADIPRRGSFPFSKVMVVVFENANYKDAVSQPFFRKLAEEGALFTNFYAETHPSQPNYIAMISGSRHGCFDDSVFNVDAANLADLLTDKGISWKVYAESYPGNCFQSAKHKTYVRKHNPFISFKSVQNDPKKCAHIVEASELDTDVKNNTVPQFSFYIPDMNNDGHDTSVEFADQWYGSKFGQWIETPNFMDGMLLVSTFDESELFSFKNQIYTSFYGSGVEKGSVSSARYDHYNLLRTIEDAFGLIPMAKNDKKAIAIQGVWNVDLSR